MPLQSESWSSAGDFSFDVPDGVSCGWLTLIAPGGQGAPSFLDFEGIMGGGGGSGECCFNQLVPLTGSSIAIHIGAGHTYGGAATTTSFGDYTVLSASDAPDGPTFGQPGGGVNGGYDTTGTAEEIGYYDSVRYFGGSQGGFIVRSGAGFGGVPIGGAPGTGIGAGGGGGAHLFGPGADGGDGDGVTALPGDNASNSGSGGGGSGVDFISPISGGTGAPGFVQISWLGP